MPYSEIASVASSVVQALATVVLVIVTIYYARQTKRTVDAMDRNSKAEFLPIIKIGVYSAMSSERTLNINLENEGKGLAKRPVKLIFPGVSPVYVNSISPKSISPNDRQKVTINYDIGYILSLPETDRKIVVEYQDVFDRTIKTEAFLKETHTFGTGANGRGLIWDAWHPVIP